SLTPNTSIAQQIDPAWNVHRILAMDMAWLREGGALGFRILRTHGAWLLIFLLGLLPFVRWNRQGRWLLVLILAWTVTAFFNPLVFGMTRLDPTRSTTFLTAFIALGLLWVFFHVDWLRHAVAIPIAGACLLAGILIWP